MTIFGSTRNVVAASAMCLALAACGSGGGIGGMSGGEMNLAAGPDACFKAVAAEIGNDAKVSEITTMFSPGSEVDSSASEPAGAVTICSAYYQNPEDPRKLLSITYVPALGGFTDPAEVEISTRGNAADFNLDDYLMPLSDVKAAELSQVFEANADKLAEKYSTYAWTGVDLVEPGQFRDDFALRISYVGRLKSNDVKDEGYAIIALDGKTVTEDKLFD
ncbi:MAG: hypothetical protein R3E18_03110 [Sphingomonadaceae bacterium]|nr:hypothetical protein [Sphingomonadaceae bacterium]